MPKKPLSRFALRILGQLAAGRRGAVDENGDLRLNGRTVPKSVLAVLLAREFVRVDDGQVRMTTVGAAHLRRQRTPRRSTQAVGAYRRQHMQLHERREEGTPPRRRPLVNRTESPLGWLVRRRGRNGRPLLSERQYLAGERLREDFEMAGLGPRLVRDYGAPAVARGQRGGSIAARLPGERSIDARRRVQAALAATGPGLSDILLRTCCFLEGLEEAERAIGWPSRSGKVVLALALDRLADFYEGKKTGARGRPGGKGMPG